MCAICWRLMLAALPVLVLGYALKTQFAGPRWSELLAASAALALLYTGLAFFTCMEPEHCELLLARIPLVGIPLRNLVRRA